MKKSYFFILTHCLLFTLCCLLSFWGCKKKETKVPEERAVNVQVQVAGKMALRPFIETIGTLNPYDEVTVSAEVDGVLKSAKVDEGTVVSKGMLLATIDDTDYDLEVKGAEAALRRSEATLANTRLEYQRKETLYKEELVTRQQFDDVSTRLSLAEADLEMSRVALSLARESLKKTNIVSPLSGVVKEKKVSAGDFVRNGTELFVIITDNPIKLNFTVTKKDVGKVKKGQDIVFRVDTFPEMEFQGRVDIVYPAVDEITRTLQVEALVPNPRVLKPGMFASVILYTGLPKETVLVPATSLLYEEEKIKVFVVENKTAIERLIKVGQKYGEMTEVTEGLKEGELVVTVGQQNLFEGAKVNVVN
jgi:RND family efflux transporter MFP subunit